jgi:leucyl-tRNA synthetase
LGWKFVLLDAIYGCAQRNRICKPEALAYWESVDFTLVEANTQLDIYCTSRFGTNSKNKGFAPTEEPFKKLINQGMILGTSAFVSSYHRNNSNRTNIPFSKIYGPFS